MGSTASVILVAGQSNANVATPIPVFPINYSALNGQRLYGINNQWDYFRGGGVLFGPDLSAVHQRGNCTLAIKHSASGTDLANDWDAATGPEYALWKTDVTNALADLDSAGISYSVDAIFWVQGESDAAVEADANAYEANLNALIADMRSHVSDATLPFIIAEVHDDWPATYVSTVQAAEAAVAAGDANAYLYDTSALAIDATNHYGPAAMITLGEGMEALIP